MSDVMEELFPLLEVYTSFVEQYENAMSHMTTWSERCSVFGRLVMEVEVRTTENAISYCARTILVTLAMMFAENI